MGLSAWLLVSGWGAVLQSYVEIQMTSVATVATQLKLTVLQNSWLFPESHHEPALCNTLENSPDSS